MLNTSRGASNLTSLAFIHSPIRDGDEIAELVRNQQPETLHLDFKATFWEDNPKRAKSAAQEAAKDVAAFANSHGGTIVLGVDDSNNQACGWNAGFDAAEKRDKTLELLRDRLDPVDIINHLDVREVSTIDHGVQRQALIVNVPPWPYGVIGVRKDNDSWWYPFRVKDDTKFYSLGEAMILNNATHRPLLLRFKQLLKDGPPHPEPGNELSAVRIRFASAVLAQGVLPNSARIIPVPVPLHLGCHGALVEVRPESIVMAMNGYPRGKFDGSIRPETDIGRGERLSVPYELVKAVWLGMEAQNPAVHLALQATVRWMGDHWALDMKC